VNLERVAGIEPASLAWKAKGFSRRRLIIFIFLTSLIQNRTWNFGFIRLLYDGWRNSQI